MKRSQFKRLEPYLQKVNSINNFIKWKLFIKNYSKDLNNPNWNFTNSLRGDGGASQVLRIWSIIDFSDFLNSRYHYTKIENIEHNYHADKDFQKKWESVFIKDIFTNVEERDTKDLDFKECKGIWEIEKNENKYEIEHALDFWVRYPNRFQKFTEFVKKQYFKNNNLLAIREKKIVVHIRRGDVNQKDYVRFLPDSYYLNLIAKLKNDQPNYEIEIITNEVEKPKLEMWKTQGKIFSSLDLNPFDAIKKMSSAEIFVASRSSMSTIGAMLSSGKTYYPKFSQPFLPEWINSNKYIRKYN